MMKKETTKQRKPFNAKLFYRRTCLIVYDIISVILASYGALLLRYGFEMSEIPDHFVDPINRFLPLNIIITLIILYLFRMYNSLWAFAGETELQNLVMASVLSSILQAVGIQFFKTPGQQAVPGSYYFLYMFLLISCIFASRFSYRFFRSLKHKKQNKKNSISVMVIGAGEAANIIIKEIVNSNFSTMVIEENGEGLFRESRWWVAETGSLNARIFSGLTRLSWPCPPSAGQSFRKSWISVRKPTASCALFRGCISW